MLPNKLLLTYNVYIEILSMSHKFIKWYVPITFSSPRAQPEVVLWLVLKESPHFPHYNSKISASNSIYFGSYGRKCTLFWYTNFDVCIFITQHHFLIFAPGEKIRSNLEVKLYKMCLRDQGWSFNGENTHVKMGTSPLSFITHL